MEVRQGGPKDRAFVERVLVGRWGSTSVVSRNRTHDAGSLPTLVAESDGVAVGLLTYAELNGDLEVVTFDSLGPRKGIGTALLERAVEIAVARNCHRIWLVTTNDNLAALRFYQRRGFRMVALRPGAIEAARRAKPGIPAVGNDRIPLTDEIELERVLRSPDQEGTVTLRRVTEPDRPVLANLLHLYLHDFSSIRGRELDDDGWYTYRYLDNYFVERGRHAWLIRHDDHLVGFAMVRELEDGRRAVAEFFVARAHRRSGIGRRAAAAMFAELPGPWELGHDLDNDEAAAFWPRVVDAVAAGPVERFVLGPPHSTVEQVVFRFDTA